MRIKIFTLVVCLSIFSLIDSPVDAQIHVAVSILPQANFVEEIGQDKVQVAVMIPPGGNPHTYEPTPGQLKALSDSVLYFKVGSGLEFEMQWLEKISSLNQSMQIINSSHGIVMIPMAEHHHHDHHHNHTHGHSCSHDGYDPHVWLSPSNAIMMAMNIRNALIGIDPLNQDLYQRNAAELILSLSEIKDEISEKLAGLESRKFFIYHPAWGYFAADFELQQIAIESLGKDPTPRQLTNIIRQAKKNGVQAIFASPQFSQKSAQAIAKEINARVEFIDPLAKDYIENLRRAARLIAGKD